MAVSLIRLRHPAPIHAIKNPSLDLRTSLLSVVRSARVVRMRNPAAPGKRLSIPASGRRLRSAVRNTPSLRASVGRQTKTAIPTFGNAVAIPRALVFRASPAKDSFRIQTNRPAAVVKIREAKTALPKVCRNSLMRSRSVSPRSRARRQNSTLTSKLEASAPTR